MNEPSLVKFPLHSQILDLVAPYPDKLARLHQPPEEYFPRDHKNGADDSRYSLLGRVRRWDYRSAT